MVKRSTFTSASPQPYPADPTQGGVNSDGLMVERALPLSHSEASVHMCGRMILGPIQFGVERQSDEKDGVQELAESVDKIELLHQISSILNHEPPPTFYEWIKVNRDTIIQNILANSGNTGGGGVTADHYKGKKELSLAGLGGSKEEELKAEEIFSRLIFILPETSKKDFFFYKSILNAEVSAYLKDLQATYKKTGDPHLKDQIGTLTYWLKKQHLNRNSSPLARVEKGIEAAGAALKIPLLMAAKALDLLRYIDAAAGFATLGINNVLNLGFSIFDFARSIRHQKIHKKWAERYLSQPRVIDKTREPFKAKASEEIEALLKQRHLEEKRKMERGRCEIEELLEKIKVAITLDEVQALLREKGIRLEDIKETLSLDSLKEELHKSEVKERLLCIYARHQDTIQISSRQALLTSEAMKVLSVQKKLGFSIKLSLANLFLTTLAVATVVVLNVLVMTAILTVPPFALILLAALFFAAVLILGGVGLLYFYRKNPHRFKEIIKGVDLRLRMYEIPAAFRRYFLKRKQQKQIDELAATYKLRVQIQQIEGILGQFSLHSQKLSKGRERSTIEFMPSGLSAEEVALYKKQLEKLESLYKKKIKSYEYKRANRAKKIQRLEKKVKYWNAKKKPFLDRLKQAGVADYLHEMKLFSSTPAKPAPLSKIIVDGIFTHPHLLDQETLHILDRRFGIDVRKRQAEGDFAIKHTVQKHLDDYFALTEKKFIHFIWKKMEEIQAEEQTTSIYV
ncbi:hypothetical protein [Parachlamydia sp. AcF125]|uniref:hypothetical protein n=1 Tax=Parachlamydia sp. AcF125 TaxID=2795736 RepID=UPI001BCA4979|nr:hypothetical protein [Parachlamydia sp. AcF125]MBS4167578.1 hypothetical protein [Parachlamydia sp. AcF125]